MSVNIVPRSVDQTISETVQRRIFIGEADVLKNPDLTPILTVTTKIGNRRKPAPSTRVEWIEDDFVGHWGQVNNGTTDYSSVATSIAVVDGTFFAVGDLVAVPKANSNSAAEEIIRVTANASNTLTVTRGVGGAGADTIPATGDLRIVASAYAEGAAYGTVRNTTKVVQVSYTQIFRRPVQITKSDVAQARFGPPNERLFQRRKALEEHRLEIESAGLYSRPSESLALGAPGTIRSTMGIKNRIATNVYNANVTLTESGMESFAQLAFSKYFQGSQKLLVAAAQVISAFDFFSLGHLRTEPGEMVAGVKVKRYNTSHGDFLIIRDLNLEASPNSGLGWGDEAYALDMDSIELAPLVGNGENRDTQLLENVIKDGSDKYSDEYLTECAWCIRHEARHARLYNLSTWA